MNKFRFIPLLVLITLFSYVVSLPSGHSLGVISSLQQQLIKLDDATFVENATLAKTEENYSKAFTLYQIAALNSHDASDAKVYSQELYRFLKVQGDSYNDLILAGLDTGTHKSSWEDSGVTGLTAMVTPEFVAAFKRENLQKKQTGLGKALRKTDALRRIIPRSVEALTLLELMDAKNSLSPRYSSLVANSLMPLEIVDNLDSSLIESALKTIIPVHELFKRCQTWGQFEILIKHVQSQRQLAILLKLSEQKNALGLLNQLLTVAEKDGLQTSILGYVNDTGIDGINRLYNVMNKGAAGIRLAVENPNQPIKSLALNERDPVMKWWIEKVQIDPYLWEALRYAIMSVIISFIITSGIQHKHLARLLFVKDPENCSTVTTSVQVVMISFVIFSICFLFNFFMAGAPMAPFAQDTGAVAGSMQPGMAQAVAEPKQAVALTGMSILALVVIVFLQFSVYSKAINELKKIKSDEGTSLLKLSHLKNADIFFDLPIYLGLLGTVSSFIIILFDPNASRIVAYSSTIIGIIFSASLRVFYVYPFQKELTVTAAQTGE